MKVLVVGNGGREHAICWKLKKDDAALELYCAPGNAGTFQLGTNLPIAADDIEGLVAWASAERPDLVVVGPEGPLCLGLADRLTAAGIPVFGPNKLAARMEGSKQFAKAVMKEGGVPTANAETVSGADEARAAVQKMGVPIVLKADGLAAGKGVLICMTPEEAEAAIVTLFEERTLGDAAAHVLVEEFLEGEEVSLLAFVDGATVVPMVSAQDHKRVDNDDQGPNTGGMGAYSPAPALTPELQAAVMETVFRPVIAELATHGIDYKGVLYAGLMLTKKGIKVLEFNCRFGDPETQCILPRLTSPLLPILQACAEGRLKPEMVAWDDRACVCVVMVAGGYPGPYEKGALVSGLDEAAAAPDTVLFHAGTTLARDGTVTNGGRVLGVSGLAPALPEAVKHAYKTLFCIKFAGAHYRTDIAARALNRT